MITSTASGYTASVDNGIITVYMASNASLVVGHGSAVQLLDSDALYLFWIADTGALQKSTVTFTDGALTMSTPVVLATSTTGFFTKDIPGFGIAYAYITATVLNINILGTSYVGTWDLARFPDFTFDISADLSTLSVLYVKPGSPPQAFIDYYGTEPEPEPILVETIAMLRLYDFELGAHQLAPVLTTMS